MLRVASCTMHAACMLHERMSPTRERALDPFPAIDPYIRPLAARQHIATQTRGCAGVRGAGTCSCCVWRLFNKRSDSAPLPLHALARPASLGRHSRSRDSAGAQCPCQSHSPSESAPTPHRVARTLRGAPRRAAPPVLLPRRDRRIDARPPPSKVRTRRPAATASRCLRPSE